MELKIISVGQLKNNPILEIQKDYQKRILNLSKSVGFKKLLIKELPISKKVSAKERQIEETEIISKYIEKNNYNIFLDSDGDNIDSLDISKIISKNSFDGKNLIFSSVDQMVLTRIY